MLVRDKHARSVLVAREKAAIVADIVAIHKERGGVGDDDAGVGAPYIEAMKTTHFDATSSLLHRDRHDFKGLHTQTTAPPPDCKRAVVWH